MPFVLDPGLKPYATDRQWQLLTELERHQSERKAAKELGVNRALFYDAKKSVQMHAARAGYAPEHGWNNPVPVGYFLKGTSTLRDAQTGEARLVWEKTSIDQEAQQAALQAAVEAMCEDIKPLKPIKAPKHTATDLMSVYPVGDHHIGQLSWKEEAEADYDTKISERLLCDAVDFLVGAAPASKVGLIILLGDFLHYDSYESVTPQSKHLLDADSRFPRIVRAAIRTVRHVISRALEKHETVRVIVVGGNHDPSSMVFLRESMAVLYEKDKRVQIDRSPKLFHYYRFGKSMIGAHHGDKVKMNNLPLLMAADRPEDWGQTKHRYIYTGHVHHDSAKDFNGAKVESVRILAPADAYAYGAGYRTPRDMKRIDIHAEFGEVGRQTVTPEMVS